jgi:hypothetical protein
MKLIAKHWIFMTVIFGSGLVGHTQDAAESPTSTVKRSVQVEFATSHESYLQGELKNDLNTLFSGVFLYGISDHLELRAGIDFQEEILRIDGVKQPDRLSGFSPLLMGLGYDFLTEKGFRPQMTAIADVFLPFTSGSDFGPIDTSLALRSVFNHTLGADSNLIYNFGIILGADDEGNIYLYTLTYYTNITNNFGFYTELFGDFHKGASANHFCDLGLFYQIHPRIQLETIIGTGLRAKQDIYFNGRITITIPQKLKTKQIKK